MRTKERAILRSRHLPTCLALSFALCGCNTLGGAEVQAVAPAPVIQVRTVEIEHEVYRKADLERVAYLEREVAWLQADLAQAEETMISVESGLRGTHTRAGTVSMLAEARIAVERAAEAAPWQAEEIEEARRKLEEAERQIQASHLGSADFFAAGAMRIAEHLSEEAVRVQGSETTRYIKAERVNLREGPSTANAIVDTLFESMPVFLERSEGSWGLVRTLHGQVGWVHLSLLRRG
jgi:hypothetical protein